MQEDGIKHMTYHSKSGEERGKLTRKVTTPSRKSVKSRKMKVN